jgi:hypothetical protein
MFPRSCFSRSEVSVADNTKFYVHYAALSRTNRGHHEDLLDTCILRFNISEEAEGEALEKPELPHHNRVVRAECVEQLGDWSSFSRIRLTLARVKRRKDENCFVPGREESAFTPQP